VSNISTHAFSSRGFSFGSSLLIKHLRRRVPHRFWYEGCLSSCCGNDLATVDHFNLADETQGAQADFFWAVGAPSPFPFFRDPQRKNVQVIQVAYAGLGLGPNKRDIFLRLLRQVHSR